MQTTSSHPPVSPYLALALGILAVSTASILIRYAQAEMPSLVIAAGRLTLATLALAPVALTRHQRELRALDRRAWLLAGLSGIFLALHFATWITSLEYTTVASSVILVTTTPLWVALLSPVVLREPLTRPVLVGMLLTLVGGVVIGLTDACAHGPTGWACPPIADFIRGQAFWGDLLALCGAWMAAGYVMIGRRVRARMSLIGYIFLVYGMAAIVLVGLMLLAGHSPLGYSAQAYAWLVLLALLPQLLGHSTFNWALRYLSAAYVSITLLGEPIGTIILAYFLLGESPAVVKLIGAILILVGIYVASRSAPPTPLAGDPPAGRVTTR